MDAGSACFGHPVPSSKLFLGTPDHYFVLCFKFLAFHRVENFPELDLKSERVGQACCYRV